MFNGYGSAHDIVCVVNDQIGVLVNTLDFSCFFIDDCGNDYKHSKAFVTSVSVARLTVCAGCGVANQQTKFATACSINNCYTNYCFVMGA